jgi:hypothetical protein
MSFEHSAPAATAVVAAAPCGNFIERSLLHTLWLLTEMHQVWRLAALLANRVPPPNLPQLALHFAHALYGAACSCALACCQSAQTCLVTLQQQQQQQQ